MRIEFTDIAILIVAAMFLGAGIKAISDIRKELKKKKKKNVV